MALLMQASRWERETQMSTAGGKSQLLTRPGSLHHSASYTSVYVVIGCKIKVPSFLKTTRLLPGINLGTWHTMKTVLIPMSMIAMDLSLLTRLLCRKSAGLLWATSLVLWLLWRETMQCPRLAMQSACSPPYVLRTLNCRSLLPANAGPTAGWSIFSSDVSGRPLPLGG